MRSVADISIASETIDNWIVVWKLDHANNEENTNASHHLSNARGPGYRWFLFATGYWYGLDFHIMTSLHQLVWWNRFANAAYMFNKRPVGLTSSAATLSAWSSSDASRANRHEHGISIMNMSPAATRICPGQICPQSAFYHGLWVPTYKSSSDELKNQFYVIQLDFSSRKIYGKLGLDLYWQLLW